MPLGWLGLSQRSHGMTLKKGKMKVGLIISGYAEVVIMK